MAKTKKEIKEAAKLSVELTPEEVTEALSENGFTEEEIAEVMAINGNASAEPEPKAAVATKAIAAKSKAGSTPRYYQIQMYRNNGKLEDGKVIKEVVIDAERAERLNSHSQNSMIRYELVK